MTRPNRGLSVEYLKELFEDKQHLERAQSPPVTRRLTGLPHPVYRTSKKFRIKNHQRAQTPDLVPKVSKVQNVKKPKSTKKLIPGKMEEDIQSIDASLDPEIPPRLERESTLEIYRRQEKEQKARFATLEKRLEAMEICGDKLSSKQQEKMLEQSIENFQPLEDFKIIQEEDAELN